MDGLNYVNVAINWPLDYQLCCYSLLYSCNARVESSNFRHCGPKLLFFKHETTCLIIKRNVRASSLRTNVLNYL